MKVKVYLTCFDKAGNNPHLLSFDAEIKPIGDSCLCTTNGLWNVGDVSKVIIDCMPEINKEEK